MSVAEHLRPILDACAQGALPPAVALMHLAAASRTPEEFRDALAGAPRAHPRLRDLARLADDHPHAYALTHDMLDAVSHDREGHSVEDVAAMFDAAVRRSPAASVALYTLGDESALERATREVAACLDALGLVAPDRDLLDLGCGIGRFLVALAPRMRRLTGLDVSPAMIAEARRRCAGFANVEARVGQGRDLAGVADASVDTLLAADVFPYLVQIGPALAQTHLCEAARVLRPGGALVIFNFSYRGELADDARDLAAMAQAAGLARDPRDIPPLAHWDAAAFLLRKPGTHAGPAH